MGLGLFARFFKRSAPPVSFPGFMSGASYFSAGDIQKNTTVQACVNAIANSISILPLNLYFRNKDGSRKKAGWHALYSLLRRRPNLMESPSLFIGKLVRQVMGRGNAYLFRNIEGGELRSLHLLNPDGVKEIYDDWPRVKYRYAGKDYGPDEVLHISGLVTDDYGHGIAPVELARAAVLLGIQLDHFSLSSFGNGLNTKLLVDIADMTKDVQSEEEAAKVAQTVADYIRRNYAGAENAGKPLVTWRGMTVKELQHQSSNRDAELLESRKFQELEICKMFGVPPFLVNGTYDVKYGSLEQAMTVFLNLTLSPYLRHIEQRLALLLSPYEQEVYYFEFDFNVLLRPDEKARGEFYAKLFGMGALSPAMIAMRENLDPPEEGGAARFVPANMMPLRDDVLEAYMAGAKLKAQALIAGGPIISDPARTAGDQAQ